MNQQGERSNPSPHDEQRDWWSALYDDTTEDAGRSPAEDTLDDRFDSASRIVGCPVVSSRPASRPTAEAGPAVSQPAVLRDRASGPRREGGKPSPAVLFSPAAYVSEPTALPAADPASLSLLVPDTVLDGAHYGNCTLRAASMRGDSARRYGAQRRDALLTARFGSGASALLLVAVATGTGMAAGMGTRAAHGVHRAAHAACQWIGGAIGRSHARLAEDIRVGRRSALKSGLHRLTGHGYGKLRAQAAELGLDPADYTADLRCLLLPADPTCRTRVFFGVGGGGLFRLRDGHWQDIEPHGQHPGGHELSPLHGPVLSRGTAVDSRAAAASAPATPAELAVADGFRPAEPASELQPFRFRVSLAVPGDTLLLCSDGLAEPLRADTAFAGRLAQEWAVAEPPGLAAFLAAAQLRATGHTADRTAAAVWES